jgi:hypothetical protein
MRLDKVAHHTNVRFFFRTKIVDQAGIGGREKLLPGEASPSTCGKDEESAEAIVLCGNEPYSNITEVSQAKEGLNGTLLEIR